MKTYATAAQLKARSRGQLLGKYATVVPAVLVTRMLLSCITSFTGTSVPAGNMAYLFDYLTLALTILLESVLNAGLANLFLNTICTGGIQVADVFYGFRSGTLRYMWIGIMRDLPPAIFLIPGMMSLRRSLRGTTPGLSIVGIAFLILGLILYVLLAVAFSQSYYLAVDFPSLPWAQCLLQSARLMKVHFVRYVGLILSFIPMFLLSAISLGVGQLFVTPYLETAKANFYMELMTNN